MNNDELEKILGFKPSREMRLQILKYARSNQLTPGESAQKFAMPNILFINEDNTTYDFEGERYTPEQLKKKFPYYRFVMIRT